MLAAFSSPAMAGKMAVDFGTEVGSLRESLVHHGYSAPREGLTRKLNERSLSALNDSKNHMYALRICLSFAYLTKDFRVSWDMLASKAMIAGLCWSSTSMIWCIHRVSFVRTNGETH